MFFCGGDEAPHQKKNVNFFFLQISSNIFLFQIYIFYFFKSVQIYRELIVLKGHVFGGFIYWGLIVGGLLYRELIVGGLLTQILDNNAKYKPNSQPLSKCDVERSHLTRITMQSVNQLSQFTLTKCIFWGINTSNCLSAEVSFSMYV